MFITLFIGILNVDSGELLFTNAGHNPPYLIRHDSRPELLDNRHGSMVGALEHLEYKEDTLTLGSGDLLFLYTDGVTESKDPEGNFFTDQHLSELLSARLFDSAEDVVESVATEVKRHEDGSEQTDDITILAVQQLQETT